MKKISLLLIVSLCMLGGCKDDLLKEGGGENGLTTEGTNYLAFNIVSDGGGAATRANWPTDPADDDNFHEGDPKKEEQAVANIIGSNVAIFFNSDNSFNSIRDLTPVADGTPITDRYDTEGLEVSVGTFVANLKIEEEEDLPSKVLIILNGNTEHLDKLEAAVKAPGKKYLYDGETVEAANDADFVLSYLTRRLTDEEINRQNASVVLFSPADLEGYSDAIEYCTMTNSVYVGAGNKEGDDALTAETQTGNIYSLATFTKDDVKATQDLAKESPLKVHVERLAVKVELDISKDMKQTSLGGNSGIGEDADLKFPLLLEPEKENGATTEVPKLNNSTDVLEATPVKWAFSMLGWSTNAVARRMYLFKNLDDARADLFGGNETSPHYDGDHDTKNTIKESSPFFSHWNDAPHARSYWAVDPHYAKDDIYPVQYRDAKENDVTSSYVDLTDGKPSETANMPLYYYSYTQMRMVSMGLKPSAADEIGSMDGENYTKYLLEGTLRKNLKYRYCAENVLGQKLLDNANDIWCGAATHVVIFGQLLLGSEIDDYIEKAKNEDYKSTQNLLNSVPDKLRAAGCYWNRADYMQYAYTQLYSTLSRASRIITDYFGEGKEKTITTPRTGFKWYYYGKDIDRNNKKELFGDYFTKLIEADNEVTAESLKGVHDKFDYTKPGCNGGDDDGLPSCIFRLSAAQVSNGDGRVMFGLKEGYKLVLEGKDSGGVDVSIDITPGQFLSIVYELVGYADYYAHGRMYYYAPIYHAATGLAARGASPGSVGDIGVVRNHWYKLTVSSLLQPGIPVSDPSQPIIPNIDPTDRYLGLEIHILPWHVINQTVTLQ